MVLLITLFDGNLGTDNDGLIGLRLPSFRYSRFGEFADRKRDFQQNAQVQQSSYT